MANYKKWVKSMHDKLAVFYNVVPESKVILISLHLHTHTHTDTHTQIEYIKGIKEQTESWNIQSWNNLSNKKEGSNGLEPKV